MIGAFRDRTGASLGLVALMLCSTSAWGSDPWGRPGHLRAVAEPLSRWEDLDRSRERVRLWWDAGGETAQVEVLRRGRWRVVATEARPGWTSRPMPVGTVFRLQVEGATRPSEAVAAWRQRGPGELAGVGASAGSLRAVTVGQVLFEGGSVWASTLGGGLVQVDPEGVRTLGRWEGLPDDEVITVDAEEQTVLVGTASGAALIRHGAVERLWGPELLHPRVQAVALDGGRAWLGTYRGLQRAEGLRIDVVLEPWSVFALAPATGGGVWAGYDGLQRVDADGQAVGPPLLPGERIFHIEQTASDLWAASEQSGLRRLSPGETGIALSDEEESGAYSVVLGATGPVVARGEAGLWGPDGARWGRASGLPGEEAWSVARDGDRLWVGTEAGLGWLDGDIEARGGWRPGGALPLAPWPAGLPVSALLVGEDGAWVGGARGIGLWGQPHREGADLVAAVRAPVLALLADGEGGAWAVGDRAVHLDRRGHLSSRALPGTVSAAAFHEGALWLAGEASLWRMDPDVGWTSVPVPDAAAQALASHRGGLLVLVDGSVSQLRDGRLRPFVQPREVLSMALDPNMPDHLWLGTVSGLERLRLSGPDEGSVEELGRASLGGQRLVAVAPDGSGGCWVADATGAVAHWSEGRGVEVVRSAPELGPETTGLVVDPRRPDAAVFLLTEAGAWWIGRPVSGPASGRGAAR